MQVAAQNALDLRIPLYERGEGFAVMQARLVHPPDAGRERRVVHQQKGRLFRNRCQGAVKPGEALVAERAAAFARNVRIERDQP